MNMRLNLFFALICSLHLVSGVPGPTNAVLQHDLLEVEVCGCENFPTSCENGMPSCQNDGYYDDDLCDGLSHLIPEEYTADEHYAHHVCQCPEKRYTGFDCSIVINEAICVSKKLFFDPYFINLNAETKLIECQVDFDPDGLGGIEKVYDHRVIMDMDMSVGTAEFSVTLRNADHANNKLSKLKTFLHCGLSDCTSSIDEEDDIILACSKKNCTSDYSALVGIAARAITNNDDIFKIVMEDNSGETTANLKLDASLVIIDLDLTCKTGQCVEEEPELPGTRSRESNESGVSTLNVLAIVFGTIVGVLSLLSIGGMISANVSFPKFGYGLVPVKQSNTSKTDDAAVEIHALAMPKEETENIERTPAIVSEESPRVVSAEDVPSYGGIDAEEDERSDAKGLALLFQEIGYSVSASKMSCRNGAGLQVISQVSGFLEPGQLIAIVGPSGAGKTTLLDILSGIPKSGTVTGEVTGPPLKGSEIAYLRQEDNLVPTETVEESLLFHSKMAPRSAGGADDPKRSNQNSRRKEERDAHISAVLEALRIGHLAHKRISTLSGGEKRRVSIACRLMSFPSVLLLDEPTTGLDTFSAALVVELLRSLTRDQNVGCIASIHQPTTHMFMQFDKVILMTCNGTMAYFGPPDKALSTLNKQKDQSVDGNFDELKRDEHELDVSHHLLGLLMDQQKKTHELSQRFLSSETNKKIISTSTETVIRNPSPPTHVSSLRKIAYLSGRSFRRLVREPGLLILKIIATFGISVALGLIFFNLDNNVAGAQNRMGLLFFTTIYFALDSMTSIVIFVEERKLFRQETQSNLYGASHYLTTKIFTDTIPLRVIPPIIYGLIVQPMAGLQGDAEHITTFLVTLVLMNLVSSFACFAISSFSKTTQQANFVGVLFSVFSILFGGLFLSNGTTTSVLVDLRFMSYVYYGYEVLFTNELSDLPLSLTVEVSEGYNPTFDLTGNFFMSNFMMDASNTSRNLWVLVGMVLGWIGVAFVGLKCMFRKIR